MKIPQNYPPQIFPRLHPCDIFFVFVYIFGAVKIKYIFQLNPVVTV